MKKTTIAIVAVAAVALAKFDMTVDASHVTHLHLGAVRTVALAASGDSESYAVELVRGRSYDAVAWSTVARNTDDYTCTVTWQDQDQVAIGTVGGVSEPNSEPIPNVTEVVGSAGMVTFQNDNDTVTPTVSGTYTVTVQNNGPTATTCAVQIVETTLFSPWFSTDNTAGYAAVTQIRNNTNTTRIAKVNYRTTAGAILCTQTKTIAGNGIGLSYASDCGSPVAFGAIDISHDGRLGALSANTTTLSGQSGLSFDAPFEVRAGMSYPAVLY